MIVFIDPNCPFCADLWLKFAGLSELSVGVRWVPIGYFDRSSDARAGAILSAENPFAALDMNFRRYDRAKHSGAFPPTAELSPYLRSRLEESTRLWSRIGGVTPLILYRTKKGVPRAYFGLPDSVQFARLVDSLAATRLQEEAP